MLGVFQPSDICLEKETSQHMIHFLKSRSLSLDETMPPILSQYLFHYFGMIQPKDKYHIRMSQDEGPRKVWVKDDIIFFGQNAADNLLYQSRLQEPNDDSGAIELSYTNTLFTQLNTIFLNETQTSELIFHLYGLNIHNGNGDLFQEFTLEELHNILANLADLPSHILNRLHLREFTKASDHKPLFHRGKEASAIYNPQNQRITISNNLLHTHTSKWTSTLIHELGHAFWINVHEQVKKEYTDLSFQERFPLANWTPKADACFITAYATESPEEDFAEHFAAFVEEPELFQSRCPEKYNFIQNSVFQDTRYTSEAHKNAKIFIDSQNPDSDPAVFKNPISESLQVSMKIKNEHSMELSIRVEGLYDAHSGLEELSLRFESPMGEIIQEYISEEDLIDANTGVYKKKIPISRDLYGVSTMRLVSVISTDRAKNVVVHSIDKEITISIHGTKGELFPHPKEPLTSHIKNIEQVFIEKNNGESIFDITIPVGRHEGLHRATFDWKGEEKESKISIYKSDYESLDQSHRFTRFHKNGQAFVTVRIQFPKHLLSGTYWLTKIELEYEKKSGFVEHNSKIHLPFQGHPSLAIQLDNDFEDTTIATLNENALQLLSRSHTTPNRKGGAKSIMIQVPIKGIDMGDLSSHIYVRAPSGKLLSWYLHSGMDEVQKDNDVVTFELPLDVHHEKGTYILEEIDFEEEYELADNVLSQVIFLSRNYKSKIQFKERGIQKKIQISNPSSHKEQF